MTLAAVQDDPDIRYDGPYQVFDSVQALGIPKDSVYKLAGYNDICRGFSEMEEAMSNGYLTNALLPDPIIGKRIQLPNGSSTTTALGWAATGEQDSGLAKVAIDDYGWYVNGALVTEWLASAFRINYMTAGSVFFAGANGKAEQNNGSFFWDNTVLQLKLLGTANPQLNLLYDSTHNATFQVASTGLLTISGVGASGGAATVSQWLNVGTATDAAAQGGFSAGLTSAQRVWWNVTNGLLRIYDSSGISQILLQAQSSNPGIYSGPSPNANFGGDFGGITFKYGATSSSGVRTDNTLKIANFICPHYSNSSTEFLYILPVSSSGVNEVAIGGGSSSYNSATVISFYTDATSTTPTGTIRAVITSSGNIGINNGYNARRRLDILDASNPQLRLTQTDNSIYADLQVISAGYLYVNPTGNKTIINQTLSGVASGNWRGLTIAYADSIGQVNLEDTTALAAGVGGGIVMFGIYTGSSPTTAAAVKANKVNATAGDFGFNLGFQVRTNGSTNLSEFMSLTSVGSLVLGNGAITLNATDGWIYLVSSAGTPTGTPTAFTGRVPYNPDTTNYTLHHYIGAAWRAVAGNVGAASTPTQIIANQNDYNWTGGRPAATLQRISSDAARNVTGISAVVDGTVIFISNVGSFTITLQNQNVGSLAANRIITGTGADLGVLADQTVAMIYDGTTARWRILKNA